MRGVRWRPGGDGALVDGAGAGHHLVADAVPEWTAVGVCGVSPGAVWGVAGVWGDDAGGVCVCDGQFHGDVGGDSDGIEHECGGGVVQRDQLDGGE